MQTRCKNAVSIDFKGDPLDRLFDSQPPFPILSLNNELFHFKGIFYEPEVYKNIIYFKRVEILCSLEESYRNMY